MKAFLEEPILRLPEDLRAGATEADTYFDEALPGNGAEDASRVLTLPPIVEGVEFLATATKQPPELVYGVLHQGSKLMLGGGSKSYKTWCLLDLAVSVAAGEPWLSCKTAKNRVLFVNFEVQAPFFQRRLQTVIAAKLAKLERGQFDVWNLRGHGAGYEVLVPQIATQIEAKRYGLVVFDPIYKLYGNTDENSAGAVAQLLNSLESLAVQTGAAVAFGAHYSKGNQSGKEAIDRVSGSGVFARDPDSILSFTRHEEPDAFTVEATLRNFKPVEPFVVRWQFPLMRKDDALDPTKLKRIARLGPAPQFTPDKLLKTLPADGLTKIDWKKQAADRIGIGRTRFYALVDELMTAGRVSIVGELLRPEPPLDSAKSAVL